MYLEHCATSKAAFGVEAAIAVSLRHYQQWPHDDRWVGTRDVLAGFLMGRVFPLDQDPFDPEAVPAMRFDSIFTGQRVTVESE